jgi:hypothetical protein
VPSFKNVIGQIIGNRVVKVDRVPVRIKELRWNDGTRDYFQLCPPATNDKVVVCGRGREAGYEADAKFGAKRVEALVDVDGLGLGFIYHLEVAGFLSRGPKWGNVGIG